MTKHTYTLEDIEYLLEEKKIINKYWNDYYLPTMIENVLYIKGYSTHNQWWSDVTKVGTIFNVMTQQKYNDKMMSFNQWLEIQFLLNHVGKEKGWDLSQVQDFIITTFETCLTMNVPFNISLNHDGPIRLYYTDCIEGLEKHQVKDYHSTMFSNVVIKPLELREIITKRPY